MRNRHKSSSNWGIDEGRVQLDPLHTKKNTYESVKKNILQALSKARDIDMSHMNVDVKDEEVLLTGSVKNEAMKLSAERCVQSVSEVKKVKNQLRII